MGTYSEDAHCIRHCLQALYNLDIFMRVVVAMLLSAAVS